MYNRTHQCFLRLNANRNCQARSTKEQVGDLHQASSAFSTCFLKMKEKIHVGIDPYSKQTMFCDLIQNVATQIDMKEITKKAKEHHLGLRNTPKN